MAELPGACVRGPSEGECLSKVDREAGRYSQWLGLEPRDHYPTGPSKVHRSELCVEDADNEILLEYDRGRLDRSTFDEWRQIASYSGVCFQELYDAATLRDWRDPARDRETFYGDCPCSIREVYQHVDRVQGYYQACLGLTPAIESRGFVARRRECLSRISELYESEPVDRVHHGNGEEWTIAKALRRYIWHDHIHAKSIVRSLLRQQKKGLMDQFDDPFKFGGLSIDTRSDLADAAQV